MQEIVRFSIKVEQGFPGVTKAIKTYLDPNDWLEDHMKSFCQAVAVNSEKNIISSEGSIYAFDYDDLFPDLINNIVKKAPDSKFSGNAGYYNDDGDEFGCTFVYENNKLELDTYGLEDEENGEDWEDDF